MSASTPLRALDAALFAVATLIAVHTVAQAPVAAAAAIAPATALPDPLRSLLPEARLQGEGALRWFGLAVYRARLWSPPGGWRADEPYALEIRYDRDTKGEQLVERSVEEMRHIGAGTAQQQARWREAMRRTFPDVSEGDRIIGLATPGAATRFFLNGQPLGEIDDPAFGPAFFGIWLSPRTSRPELRRMLLGLGS